jgi:hypothetical protein
VGGGGAVPSRVPVGKERRATVSSEEPALARVLALLGSPLYRIAVLDRPGWLPVQSLSGLQSPIRLPQQLATNQHDVRVAARNNLVGFLRLGNQPDRARCNVGFLPNLPRKGNLVAFTNWNLRVGRNSTRGHVDQIHPAALEPSCQLH